MKHFWKTFTVCRYGELEKRRKRSLTDFLHEHGQKQHVNNETNETETSLQERNGNLSQRIKRTVNALYQIPNNDETNVNGNKYPWEVLLFMRLGKEGSCQETQYGCKYDLACPIFSNEDDTWNVWDQRKDELENKIETKQCSGSLITNRHILTSAECVSSNSDYLRIEINLSLKHVFQSSENLDWFNTIIFNC